MRGVAQGRHIAARHWAQQVGSLYETSCGCRLRTRNEQLHTHIRYYMEGRLRGTCLEWAALPLPAPTAPSLPYSDLSTRQHDSLLQLAQAATHMPSLSWLDKKSLSSPTFEKCSQNVIAVCHINALSPNALCQFDRKEKLFLLYMQSMQLKLCIQPFSLKHFPLFPVLKMAYFSLWKPFSWKANYGKWQSSFTILTDATQHGVPLPENHHLVAPYQIVVSADIILFLHMVVRKHWATGTVTVLGKLTYITRVMGVNSPKLE